MNFALTEIYKKLEIRKKEEENEEHYTNQAAGNFIKGGLYMAQHNEAFGN
jgi:hypothetical protein